jgi:hypothetical protein
MPLSRIGQSCLSQDHPERRALGEDVVRREHAGVLHDDGCCSDGGDLVQVAVKKAADLDDDRRCDGGRRQPQLEVSEEAGVKVCGAGRLSDA